MKDINQYQCCIQRRHCGEQFHHVFFGRGKRDISEKYSIKVPITQIVHEFAHGRSLQALGCIDRFFKSDLTRENIQDIMARKFCDILGIDYDLTNQNINQYFDKTKRPAAVYYLETIKKDCERNIQKYER